MMNMRDHNDAQQRLALEGIANMRNDEILSMSVDEWVDTLVERCAAPHIPRIEPAGITRTQHQGQVPVRPVPNPPYAGDVQKVPGLIHDIHIPFSGDRDFFAYEPPFSSGQFPGGAVGEHEIVLSFGGAWLKAQDIERLVDKQVALIEQVLEFFRGDAKRFRQDLSFPKIISARSDDAIRTRLVW